MHVSFIIEISFLCILQPLLVVGISFLNDRCVVSSTGIPFNELATFITRISFLCILVYFFIPLLYLLWLAHTVFLFAGIFLLSKLKSSLTRLRRKFPKTQCHNGKLYSSNVSSKRNPEA